MAPGAFNEKQFCYLFACEQGIPFGEAIALVFVWPIILGIAFILGMCPSPLFILCYFFIYGLFVYNKSIPFYPIIFIIRQFLFIGRHNLLYTSIGYINKCVSHCFIRVKVCCLYTMTWLLSSYIWRHTFPASFYNPGQNTWSYSKNDHFLRKSNSPPPAPPPPPPPGGGKTTAHKINTSQGARKVGAEGESNIRPTYSARDCRFKIW